MITLGTTMFSMALEQQCLALRFDEEIGALERKSTKICEAISTREDFKVISPGVRPRGGYSRAHCRNVFQSMPTAASSSSVLLPEELSA